MFSIKNLLPKFNRTQSDQPTEPEYYLSVCCIIKDENEYLEEWLEYHRKIGVAHFFIYDNGSKVPVKQFIKTLNYSEVTTVTDMPGQNKHVKAYQHCIDSFGHLSKWIAFIDMDEFIVPKTDNPELPEFLKMYEDYGGLGVSWQIFGSNNHVHKPAGSQLENFTRRAEVSFHPNRHIKSIVQPKWVASAYKSHCFRYKAGFFCVNEHFMQIDDATTDVSVDTIQLNHYYCRSLEEYQQKVERGISDTKRKRKLEEFHNHDRDANAVEDTTILAVLNKIETRRQIGSVTND
ncbi:glycosyltransferase family 92 protein [Dyadobacter sp. CY261]|uniref:glycosyltransferase family 92 protein n=1 Tax=Dyadobacter sp. CY261 TaxID=2907203 RepID=UPI001F1E99BA|nr:glycosyltransferase family 92 protein [Dyadobacter sp. CY261]MCF0069479.1 glycosyltransferase family 92 protein [Dyadobacter sp. CY261]